IAGIRFPYSWRQFKVGQGIDGRSALAGLPLEPIVRAGKTGLARVKAFGLVIRKGFWLVRFTHQKVGDIALSWLRFVPNDVALLLQLENPGSALRVVMLENQIGP